MSTLLADYSFAHKSPAVLKAAGFSGVMRYLGGSRNKDLTAAEANALHTAGLGIGLVWEGSASRATAGRRSGRADARAARRQANTIGYPNTLPIFFAVDFDARPAQVAPYFQGVRDILHERAGIYGGFDVIAAGLAPWRWQTAAWSRGRLHPSADLYQRNRFVDAKPVAGVDENVVCKPFPLWLPNHSGTQAIAAPAAPHAAHAAAAPAPAPALAGLTPAEVAQAEQLWNELAKLMLKAVGR